MVTGSPTSGKYRRQHEKISLRLGVHSQPGSDYACDGTGLAVLVLGTPPPPLTRPRLLQIRPPVTEAIPLPVTNGEISGRIPTGRNNTWREQRFNEDWRNNNWRTQRLEEDWQQRGNLEKQRTPNNATETGYVGGVKPTAGTNNAPTETNNNSTDTNNNPTSQGYVGER